MYDYNDLEFLRQNTILGPISLIKLSYLKSRIEQATEMANDCLNSSFEIDYSKVEELEYEMRFKQWKDRIMLSYINYGEGMTLDSFASMLIHERLRNNKEVTYARKFK